MLQVIPQKRPSCDDIIQHSRLQNYPFSYQGEVTGSSVDDSALLKTIQVPMNLKLLGNVLPKSKYYHS